jgi:hypothetical protein
MGLLIAFTFYGAASRFDARRNLTIQEASLVRKVYLRLDLLPSAEQPRFREYLRTYVRSRLAVSEKIPDISAVDAAIAATVHLQQELWREALRTTRGDPFVQSQLLPAINEMVDIAATATAALTTHLPLPVFVMLTLAIITASVLAGYGMAGPGSRDWVPTLIFTILLSIAVYVIIDYEFPRVGLIRVDATDEVLVKALENMK